MNALATLSPPTAVCSAESKKDVVNAAEAKVYGWILHPAIDLLCCCGGLVWILFALHYFVLGQNSTNIQAQSLLTLAALGTIFLGETHTVASLVRLYDEKRFQERFSVLKHLLPLALSALALMACSNKELPPILAKIYLLIVSQHFTKQTYGIVLLYCLKRNFKMDLWDKRLLAWLMQATMIFAVIRQLTFASWSGGDFLGQKIPFWGPLPEWMFVACSLWMIASAALFLGRLMHRFFTSRESFPFPALMLTFTGVAIFVLGSKLTGTLWIYVPAFFHGSQYLAVTTSVFLKEKGALLNLPPNQISTLLFKEQALRYFGFLCLTGIAVFIGIPHILQQFGFNYAMAVTAIFTTVQFHHVIVDHAIWRMKDKGTRDLLV